MIGIWCAGCGGSREPWHNSSTTRTFSATGAAGAGNGDAAGAAGSDPNAAAGSDATGAIFDCPSSYDAALPGLRTAKVTVGVAVANGRLSETLYAAGVVREFNSITPENEMKWNNTESSPGSFTFSAADELMRFAEKNQLAVRGHTLVWHNQLPDWVTGLSDADSVRAAMRRHIESVMAHFRDQFPGRVVAWDVVNEAIESVKDADGNTVVSFRNSVFYQLLGEGYIAEAFRIAHQVDPKALLYYNDYGIEGMSAKSTAVFEMVTNLLQQGVPISGVGMQMHTHAGDFGPALADFEANLARYAAAGIPVNISEMDVSICYAEGTLEERLQAQRVRYNAVAAACLRSGNCKSITIWGLGDSDSWLNSTRACSDAAFTPSPLLFDIRYQRKPAWAGLSDALRGCWY